MNKERRKRIEEVVGWLSDAHTNLENIHDEEQEAYDNLPEGLQNGEQGQTMLEKIEQLNDARDALSEIISTLEDAQS